ncbi:MAG TPA: hypothetical protein VER32_02245 [Pyrinomonadaceae bacterium]|nr:hypothetical protein [Pyrinomonadaceae bacterium]
MFTKASPTFLRASLLRIAAALAVLFGAAALVPAPATEARAQGRVDSRLLSRAQSVTGDSFRVYAVTPRGARVYAVARPRVETLRAIDSGLSDLFAVARRRGYSNRLNHSDYTIFIGRPDRTHSASGAYSPDIAVGAAQYAGSVYDQGGFVYAAGMVLSMQPGAFVIAEHERDWGRVRDVTRFEGEHIVLYHNDRALYRRTADHSRGGGHPIVQYASRLPAR